MLQQFSRIKRHWGIWGTLQQDCWVSYKKLCIRYRSIFSINSHHDFFPSAFLPIDISVTLSRIYHLTLKEESFVCILHRYKERSQWTCGSRSWAGSLLLDSNGKGFSQLGSNQPAPGGSPYDPRNRDLHVRLPRCALSSSLKVEPCKSRLNP